MSVTINSTTTNYYDYSVGYNYYTRQVSIADTSSYKTGGAALVGLQSYTITSPSGNVQTGTIDPASPTTLVKNMGLFGNGIEAGTYTIVGVFTDQDLSTYTLTKTTTLCLPTQNETSTAANGCVTLGWTVRCIDNLVIVADQTPMSLTVNSVVYAASSKTYGITVVNPLGVILANNVNTPYFQITPIVNGSYAITINDTAVYTIGDGVTVTVHYLLTATKNAECNIDLCDVYCCVNDTYTAWLAVQGQGSVQERTLKSKWEQLSLLIGLAQIAISCGNDVSTLLEQIEEISGCTCACGCGVSNVNQGVNVLLGQNIVVNEGSGISVAATTVGNTQTIVVTNSLPETYKVETDSGDNTPDYLYNKIESTDSSLTITDVDSGGGNKKANFIVTVPEWIAITTYGTSFANTGTIYQTGRYRKWASGLVEVEACITGSNFPTAATVLTMPAGYRPTLAMVYPMVVTNTGNNYPGQAVLISGGSLTLTANTSGWTGTICTFAFNVSYYTT